MILEARTSCLCPPDGHRHPDGDVVTFKDKLGFHDVLHFQKAFGWFREEHPDAEVPETLAFLSEWYLLYCIASWTLRDQKGKAIPVSKANVETYLLAKPTEALAVVEVADERYNEVLLLPLALRASTSSPPTRTNGSTSPTPGPGPRPKRSRPSSTASTQTAAIATT